jgi:hypothetical protein
MSCSFELRAVIDLYGFEIEPTCPWEVADLGDLRWMRLSAKMTQPEIGAFFARLISYNHIERSGSLNAILREIVAADSLVLAGGIQAIFKEQIISPSCCCGLEGWRDWQNFLETGETPWLGHDPSPWIERVGDMIRIWSDGRLGDSIENAFKIEVAGAEFDRALNIVERDLLGFQLCIENWCEAIEFDLASDLAKKVKQCFEIDRRYL